MHTHDQKQIAYIIATAVGESEVEPMIERRARVGTPEREEQDKYWMTGFYGRGYVQLRYDYNYKKFGKALNLNLVGNPDMALDPDFACKILVKGMVDGLWTGKKLSTFINSSVVDFYNARKVINGTYQADKFQRIANQFLNALP